MCLMNSPSSSKLCDLRKISPLYEFWKSKQDDPAEQKRLMLLNQESRYAILFRDEPYKWEILFQGILREIIRGDSSAINGFQIILDSIKLTNKNKILKDLKDRNILSDDLLAEIKNFQNYQVGRKRKFLRFIRILFAIFTNRYGVDLKRSKNHSYEYSGAVINSIRNFLA